MIRRVAATLVLFLPLPALAEAPPPFALAQPGLGAPPEPSALADGAGDAAPIARASRGRLRADGGWTGFYGGVQLGFGDGNLNRGGGSDTGVLGGAHAGYLHDFNSFVAGVEASVSLADIEFDKGAGGDIDTLARLGVRLGRAFGDTLVYGAAGGAFVDGDYGGRNEDELGYFVGGGIEHRLNTRWSVGVAANYHRFDGYGGPGRDLDLVTVEGRLSLRF